MKKTTLAVLAAPLLAATLFMGSATADSVGDALIRNSNFSPTDSSACLSSWVGAQRVQVIGSLGWFGTNINIAPNGLCWRRQRPHNVEVITDCFSGAQFFDQRSGTAFVDADISRDCVPHGGGKDALFAMNAF